MGKRFPEGVLRQRFKGSLGTARKIHLTNVAKVPPFDPNCSANEACVRLRAEKKAEWQLRRVNGIFKKTGRTMREAIRWDANRRKAIRIAEGRQKPITSMKLMRDAFCLALSRARTAYKKVLGRIPPSALHSSAMQAFEQLAAEKHLETLRLYVSRRAEAYAVANANPI